MRILNTASDRNCWDPVCCCNSGIESTDCRRGRQDSRCSTDRTSSAAERQRRSHSAYTMQGTAKRRQRRTRGVKPEPARLAAKRGQCIALFEASFSVPSSFLLVLFLVVPCRASACQLHAENAGDRSDENGSSCDLRRGDPAHSMRMPRVHPMHSYPLRAVIVFVRVLIRHAVCWLCGTGASGEQRTDSGAGSAGARTGTADKGEGEQRREARAEGTHHRVRRCRCTRVSFVCAWWWGGGAARRRLAAPHVGAATKDSRAKQSSERQTDSATTTQRTHHTHEHQDRRETQPPFRRIVVVRFASFLCFSFGRLLVGQWQRRRSKGPQQQQQQQQESSPGLNTQRGTEHARTTTQHEHGCAESNVRAEGPHRTHTPHTATPVRRTGADRDFQRARSTSSNTIPEASSLPSFLLPSFV
jgi:hypothetical protein